MFYQGIYNYAYTDDRDVSSFSHAGVSIILLLVAVLGASGHNTSYTISETELDTYFDSCSSLIEDNSTCSANKTTILIECVLAKLKLTIKHKLAHCSLSVYFDILCVRFRFWFQHFFGVGIWIVKRRVCITVTYGKICN